MAMKAMKVTVLVLLLYFSGHALSCSEHVVMVNGVCSFEESPDVRVHFQHETSRRVHVVLLLMFVLHH